MSNLLISTTILLSIHSMVHMLCHADSVAHYLSSFDAILSLIFGLLASIALETNEKLATTISSKTKLFCDVCKTPKSLDSHHCSRCRRCVYKMDHHCIFVGNCIGESNMWRYMLLLSASMVDIGGYALLVITMLQRGGPYNRMHQLLLVSLLLLLLLLLLFVSSLFTRTLILKSCGMTYIDFKQRFARNRDADDEIVVYIP